MTLREPPKQKKAAGVIGRLLGLVLLLAAFALAVWTAATLQQIGALERSDPDIHAPGEYVSVSHGSIHFRTVGSGDPVTVLIHADTIAGGGPLVPLAEGMAGDRTVLVPDLIGFGFSSRPSAPGRGLTTTGQAESVVQWLDRRDEETVELVGFGWGGGVATEVAVRRPDLVSRLVLVDVADLPVPDRDLVWLQGLPFGVGQAFAHTFEGGADGAQRDFLEDCPPWADCADPDVAEERLRAATVPGTARAIWARRATDPASVAAARLDEATMPVQIVAVETPRELADELAGRFPRGEVIVVDGDEVAEVIVG